MNVISETARPIFTRFHMGPTLERLLSIYSNGSAPLNKIAAILLYNIGDSGYTKFVQMMILEWPLTCSWQGQIFFSIFLYVGNVEKSFSQNVLKTNGWNLQCMIKLVKRFSYNQNFVPRELSALAYLLTSSLKQLDQCSPYFTLGLLSKGHWQFVQMVSPLKKLAAMSICGTKSSPEPRKLWGWIYVYSIWDSRSTKFVQLMIPNWWPLSFLRQDQNCISIYLF